MINYRNENVCKFADWVACKRFSLLEVQSVRALLDISEIYGCEDRAWTIFLYTLVGGTDDGDFESLRKLLPHYPPAKSSIEVLPETIIGFSFHDHRQRSSFKGETHLQTASTAIHDYLRVISEKSDDGTQRRFLQKVIKDQSSDPFHEIYSYLCSPKSRIHSFGRTSSYDRVTLLRLLKFLTSRVTSFI